MNKKLILLALCLAPLAAACGQPVRSVTHVAAYSTEKGDYFYVAYAESGDISKVQRCTVNPDNSIACVQENEVNKLLNAGR